jgi:hypothetical protein
MLVETHGLECQTNGVGDVTRAEIPHHARSVNFDSPGTYSKRVSDHLFE